MSDAYNMENYPELVRDFCMYKSGIQARSPKTVKEYMLDLRTFCRYMYAKRNGLPMDKETFDQIDISKLDTEFFAAVTTEDVTEFVYYLNLSRNNEPSARARKLSAVREFYRYFSQKRRILPTNPAANVENPKDPKKKSIPKHLTIEESLDLLAAIRDDAENKYRTRDYAMITLFLNCGMRLSELAGIKMNDIAPDFESLRVTGKGAKERIIYLNSACREALAAYLPDRLTILAGGRDDHLFLSRLGSGISVKTVQHVVKKYLAAAGLGNRNFSTHKLRHTAATLMYQTGNVDIRVLKDILGHEQLSTTQIYTHVSDRSMAEAMEKNPLAGISPGKKDE